MQSIIRLLPEAIANQIAAGEVVQRPASVVKELLENAVDAQADRIDLHIKDAGKTLIQVTDNGLGMSAHDARMAFERHATSKIQKSDDLFNITSMGFRGEALASIAAVAQVKLKTRLHSEELGTELDIDASIVKSQESCTCPKGSVFQVKNLFHNVPARRNFLKSNPVETRHILNEFIRLALAHPDIHFSFRNQDTEVYNLSATSLKERLVQIFKTDVKEKLIYIEEEAGYANMYGFIGNTALYKNTRGDQFFFVNKRYIKSSYLNHAIHSVYQEFIPEKAHPFYCIFIDIDPRHIDINIHPTKTEIKFDDEKTLYILLNGLVKRGLAEEHRTPEFNFDDPILAKSDFSIGSFEQQGKTVDSFQQQSYSPSSNRPQTPSKENWDQLYRPQELQGASRHLAGTDQNDTGSLFETSKRTQTKTEPGFIVQFQQTYILLQLKELLYIIHQQLAHQRILYERFMQSLKGKQLASQQLLFPQTIELSPLDFSVIMEADPVLNRMGFEIKEFGKDTIIIYGTPIEIPTSKIRDIFSTILADIKDVGHSNVDEKVMSIIARSISEKSAVTSTQKLSMLEMKKIADELFQCEMPGYAPNGKPTYRIISAIELEDYFV